MSQPIELLSPDQVLAGTYRIVRSVGRGGMGQVYEATHERLSGRYAVKLLLRDFGANEDVLRRFKQEADVTSRLRHPNIVQVIDFAELPDGSPYMVMEFLDGSDLAHELQRLGRIPPVRAADILEQVAAGLEAAHAEGVVHRDLKPANIFLTKLKGSDRELAKVVDFGISKIRAATAGLTQTQTVIGTPQYMSPEQARGQVRTIDARTDQFALGAIAYELLSGAPAFTSDTVASIIYQVVHEPAAPLVATGTALDARLDAVVRRAMAKDPQDRWSSVSEFARAFRQALEGDADLLRSIGSTVALPPPAVRTSILPASSPGAGQTTMGGAAAELHPRATRARAWPFVAASIGVVALLAGLAVWRGGTAGSNARKPSAAPEPPHAQTPAARSAVTITVKGPEGLTATVDGTERALPLVLPKGAIRSVVFSAPGYVPLQREVVADEDLVLELALAKVPAPAAAAPKPPAAERAAKPPRRRQTNVVTDL